MNDPTPVPPRHLRVACLEAAAHLVRAEQALMRPWLGVRLAPIPPGARPPGYDAAPEVFPLGRWGSVVAELRQDLDILLDYAGLADVHLWCERDERDAARQAVAPRNRADNHLTDGAGSRRLSLLEAVHQLLEVERCLAESEPTATTSTPWRELHHRAIELLHLARTPLARLTPRGNVPAP